jgi:Cytochrome P460
LIPDIGDVTKRETTKVELKGHEIAFGAVYMNEPAQAALLQSRQRIFAEGAVIVRERMETETASPELLAVMIKRRRNFNPAANDWEFVLLNGNATKIKKREKTGACQRCHAIAASNDFVFANYALLGLQTDPTFAPK